MLRRGPHLDPAGQPGARAARAGPGSPKGGLISFPRAAEVSAQCLSHLFKFYGAWLVAAGPRPGEEAGAGSGSLPRPRGGPRTQGAGQARGAQTLRGTRPATPLWFPGTFQDGGLGCPGPKGGVCLGAPQAWPRPFSRLLGLPHLPPPAPRVLGGAVVGRRWWWGLMEEGIGRAEIDTSLGAPVALPNPPPTPTPPPPASLGSKMVLPSPEARSSTQTSGR